MLKEIAVSAILTAEDINDMIHDIVDYRVAPWCCGGPVRRQVFDLYNTLNDRSAEHDVAGVTARICTTLENSGNISNRSP